MEFYDPVTGVANRHGQEDRRSTRLELYRDQPALFPGVNGGGSPVRSREYSAAAAMNGAACRSTVGPKFILIQIDHQVRLACRQYPLHRGGKFGLMVVKRCNEGRQRL
jgi:hypothetical protein